MKTFYLFILVFLNLNYLTGKAQSLKINEFQARNVSTVTDNFQEYDDWVEIANLSGQEVDLNGYYITDDLGVKSKFRLSSAGNELHIPPGGFLILWADDDENQGYDHLSFNISGNAGLIALFSPTLQLIDSVNYSQQYMDISMGRTVETPHNWRFFSLPTPAEQNTSQPYNGVLAPPSFNIKSGIFSSTVNLTLYPSHLPDSVYYSLNNTTPTIHSSLYHSILIVDKTKVVNAVDAKSGFINSTMASQVYLMRPAFTLPVVAVLTDSLNLFGPKGIYTNYNKPWERYCQIKYITNGAPVVEATAGIRIQGASSTFMPKKSFRLFFRSDYGQSKFTHPVFGSGNTSSFDKLVLKSGYDDDITTDNGTLLRDALALELWQKSGGTKQLSSWVILYLNNRYWGIYNLRESIDEHFIKAHTGLVDFDLIRFRNEGPETIYGSAANWNSMFDLVGNTDLSKPENYQSLADILDMDDFINLMAFVQFTGYYSWGWGLSMYRENAASAQWKTSIWDADRAFDDPEWNCFQDVIDKTYDLFWANIIPKNLMTSATFQQKYAIRILELLQTVFKPENAVAVLDSIYNIVAPEIEGELHRWAPYNDQWENNVEKIRDFLRRRPGIVKDQMKDYLPRVVLSSGEPLAQPQYIKIYPNPFSDQVNIRFCLRNKGKVEIVVYDQEGRQIKNLVSGISGTEEKTVSWDGSTNNGVKVIPGLYFIRIVTPDELYYAKIIRK